MRIGPAHAVPEGPRVGEGVLIYVAVPLAGCVFFDAALRERSVWALGAGALVGIVRGYTRRVVSRWARILTAATLAVVLVVAAALVDLAVVG